MTDAEWEERQKARQEEIKGCSEALAILSSDDAHDTFTRTFNFVQVSISKRERASAMLLTAAKKLGKPQLATLATRVRLDAFKKVTEQIDGMVKALKKEKADDIKMKDFCTEELNKNERRPRSSRRVTSTSTVRRSRTSPRTSTSSRRTSRSSRRRLRTCRCSSSARARTASWRTRTSRRPSRTSAPRRSSSRRRSTC